MGPETLSLSFERTSDYGLVRDILTDPKCWRRMTDDQAPPPDQFHPGARDGLEYVVVREGGRPAALFLLLERGGAAEVHFCFCPQAWGRSVDIARAFLTWVWTNTGLVWLIGPVPQHNRLALRLAKAAGFTMFCEEKQALSKDGVKYDRILLQARRPE